MDPKTLHIKTFGCQMNVYDSDRMVELLKKQGLVTSASLRDADVIVINTCSIRDKAEQKVLSLLGELKPLKERKKDRVIGIAGCVGQRMGMGLLQRAPHLDFVIGPDGIDRIGSIIDAVINRGERCCEAKLDEGARRYSQVAIPGGTAKPSEFVTIVKGCDHFCTYCIVPFVRGREKSRSIEEIQAEVKSLVSRGTREVTFLGQNVNTYGKGNGETLASLIHRVHGLKGLDRIRYVTSHPRDLGDDLITQFGVLDKLCPALHLPFQSGNNSVLKRMSRLYRRELYLEKVEKLRNARPDIALSTDVIVGFPGETELEFADTLSLLQEVRFSSAFLFMYSPRPGTRAFEQPDDIALDVKGERLQTAKVLVQGIIEEENRTQVGRRTKVLVERLDKKGRYYCGRTPHNKIVHVYNAEATTVGKIIDVEVTDANGSNLKGYY